jgi:predicted RNase H-like nuclease
MPEYVLGLDWINAERGWACCRLSVDPEAAPALGLLSLADQESDLVRHAARVVVDAPVGLPSDSEEGCKLRDCDSAARAWVGRQHQSSVFPVPYAGELATWRERRQAGQRQKQGHFRGLLPAIDSAETIASQVNANTLESHPELAFAALLGKPLPDCAAKKTLLGCLVRLALLARAGMPLRLRDLSAFGRIGTDNFIDAVAMAVVARDWHLAGTVDVLRLADGRPEPLGHKRVQTRLMALPSRHADPRGQPVASVDELVALAAEWDRGEANHA